MAGGAQLAFRSGHSRWRNGVASEYVPVLINSIETVAGETDLTVGGELYADALSEKDGPAPDYLSLFRYNARQLLDALR